MTKYTALAIINTMLEGYEGGRQHDALVEATRALSDSISEDLEQIAQKDEADYTIFDIRPIQMEITEEMGEPELLVQTMEEAGELAQACNLYRRVVWHKGQPTSKTEKVALDNLMEEITDVIICLKELVWAVDIKEHELLKIERAKIKRTAQRYCLEE